VQYKVGQVICCETDPGDSAFIIWAGRLVVITVEFSALIIIGCRIRGQPIGEMALLEDASRSASVIALKPVILMEISHKNFYTLLKESHSFARGILCLLSMRLREASDVVESNTLEKIRDPLTGLYNRRYMRVILKQ
jgi:CRP-like cAMP-binding protein